MARESFDKEIQFLRMLALTSGAYSRQQIAERLGISVHTFDKTIRRLKEIAATVQETSAAAVNPESAAASNTDFADMLRLSYYESADPLLLFLYRAKSLKETESHRLAFLLTLLQQETHSAQSLLDACSNTMPADLPLPDEKTIRNDLKYLESVGVIRRMGTSRPYMYRLHNELVSGLDDEELLALYDFVDVMANTRVPSVQGYLLRDSLKKALRLQGREADIAVPFLYKYHYYSRILDEAHVYTFAEAIRCRQKVKVLYFTPKKQKSYASRNTNPLFEREAEGYSEIILPLKMVYDHQYGRWYLLGHTRRKGIMKFRMEGLTQIEIQEAVAEDYYAGKLAELEQSIRFSWLIDTGDPVKVSARFYHPGKWEPNFIKERVLLQGQWGQITEETDEFFIYEITVNGLTEIRPWLRSFGSSCEVLEPPALREAFIAEWKELQAYYEPVREDL
ncbi:WYL domain-containing protein [Paenibacillaceae bacterium]|nr:WYL domain-containing protein [Paenibacillaceae bacterium]